MPGFHHSVAVLPLVDNQSAFWSLRPYNIRKDVSSISVLTCNGNGIATERKNGNGMVETIGINLGERRIYAS